MTQKKLRETIQASIRTNPRAAVRALMIVRAGQTAEEVRVGATIEDNGAGFTAFDAPFLTSIAEAVESGRDLSLAQVRCLQKVMPKYWRQLLPFARAKAEGRAA